MGNYVQRERQPAFLNRFSVLDTAAYDSYYKLVGDYFSNTGTATTPYALGYGGQNGNYTDYETGCCV